MNLIKVLWCRFQQCPSTFTILLLEGSSATGLFRHLSNHVFGVFNSGNRKAVRLNFLFKIFKIWSSFKKAVKNSEICFCLWDNCIWIDFVKLFLLREGYISSAANVLTSNPKILHVNKRDFFERNFLASDKWLWSRWCDPDFNCAFVSLPYCLSKDPLKRDFLDIYLTTFWESGTSKIKNV